MNNITAMTMTAQRTPDYPPRTDNGGIPVKDKEKTEPIAEKPAENGQEGGARPRPLEPRYDEFINSADTPYLSREESEPAYGNHNNYPENIKGEPEQERQPEEGAGPVKGKPDGKKPEEEECTVNTDKVDAEIEGLKKELQDLKQQLKDAADDPDKESDLRQKMATVEAELRMKDNDNYRKQHSTYTNRKKN